MTLYVVQRLLAVIEVVAVISVLVFLATHALPATIAEVILGQYATPETIAALEAKLGLTQPLVTQYWEWASGVLRGDLGRSLVMEVPIAPVLWAALGRSAVLGVLAFAVVSVFGIALGVVAAVRRGRAVDHLASRFYDCRFVGAGILLGTVADPTVRLLSAALPDLGVRRVAAGRRLLCRASSTAGRGADDRSCWRMSPG